MSFKIGEKVVYPNHGIGVIEKITTTEIAGTQSSFYLLRLKATESTVMVPVANASEIGLRSPINNSQCEKLLKALSEDFINPPVDWKDRYKEFLERMKTGDIFHVAEVLKNLTYLAQLKPLSFREKRMLERARSDFMRWRRKARKSSTDALFHARPGRKTRNVSSAIR